MNERIKELIKQAGGEFWQRLENDVVNPEAYITFDPPQSLEKFAELVVEECRYVMDCNKGSDQHTEWNRALSETSDKIQKHFGVEE